GIFEDDTDFVLAGGEGLVNAECIIESDAPGGERFQIDQALLHGVQRGLEIALLGPANETDGIIVAAPFVIGIVTARAVGTRKAKLDFLVRKHSPGKLNLCDTNIDDATAIAAR